MKGANLSLVDPKRLLSFCRSVTLKESAAEST
jgi:hypothetical protein